MNVLAVGRRNKMNNLDKIKKLEAELEELKKEIQGNKNWKPKYEEIYWYVDDCGDAYTSTWEDRNTDKGRWEIENVFKTEPKAKEASEKQKIRIELERFAKENNEEIDWTDYSQEKYYIFYDYDNKKFDVISMARGWQHINQIFFTDGEVALKAIETIGEERLKKLLM
jgi:hypothetical protein